MQARPLRLSTTQADFETLFQQRLHWSADTDAAIEQRVADILADVKARGDAAVLEYTARFDALQAPNMAALELTQAELKAAFEGLPKVQQQALQDAAARVRSYHEAQKKASGESWQYRDADGNLLGQKVTPLDRVGIYVPGGKAAYPSSVLMNAIPAHVAGVGEIIMVVPTPAKDRSAAGAARAEKNPLVLAAAYVAGVTRAFTIGGAQAVAALAYGTATVPAVDKITGPGNAYVAAAKRRVFGTVGIDMIAGPSEILVLADGSTPADWVAMDLFSQAEHDELAQRHHRRVSEWPRRFDTHTQHARGLRHQQPHRARAFGSVQPQPSPVGAAAQTRGCHLFGRFHQREFGRLLCRPQPCAAHLGHRAVFFAAGGVRFSKTLQPHRGQRTRRSGAGPNRLGAGPRRGLASPCTGGRNATDPQGVNRYLVFK